MVDFRSGTRVDPELEAMMRPVYLGDAVYAVFDGFSISLRLNHHGNTRDQIRLEPGVQVALQAYMQGLEARVSSYRQCQWEKRVQIVEEDRGA